MKRILILLLLASPVSAQSVTPNFTQGSMQSNTTTTTDIQRVQNHVVYGGDYSSWSGTNVTVSGDIGDPTTTYTVTDPTQQWQLELVERAAGIVETIDITEDIQQVSTTTSLSVFSQ